MNFDSANGQKVKSSKLSVSAHLMCGWPLLLVAFGGAIGGGLGGAAYAINVMIYKSRLPTAGKIVLNLMAGCAAIVLWVFAATMIQLAIRK
jgi:hypothetical protein